MSSLKTLSATEAAGQANALIVDVRTPAEHEEMHVSGAVLKPLPELQPVEIAKLASGRPIQLLCRSGGRARQAAERLQAAGVEHVSLIEGGIEAWQAAGLPVVRGRKTISLERQVRIGAGLLVLLGVVLGLTAHIGFVGLSAFVGAGLIFAGVTDHCGMAMLLARMPWNTRTGSTKSCAVGQTTT